METHKPDTSNWAYIHQEHLYKCRNQKKIADPLLQQTLADFKVGVDNVIFSVDTSQTGCWFC